MIERKYIAIMLLLLLLGHVTSLVCGPGYWWYERDGIERCRPCAAGCSCAGGLSPCLGCSGGFYSSIQGSPACFPCPLGEISDQIFNTGCDPSNTRTPCQNEHGPLGVTSCRPAGTNSTQLSQVDQPAPVDQPTPIGQSAPMVLVRPDNVAIEKGPNICAVM
jgi:hypothetical protein